MNQKEIKKILVVAESIDVEDSSGTKGRVALIKNLHKAGFELQVHHYTRKDIKLPGIKCFPIKENRRSFLFILSRLERYLRNWLKINPNKYIEKLFGFSFTLFNDRNSIVAGLKQIRNFEPDLVLTLSKGGSFRPHHALLKLPEWHSIWIAYIHDPYPMHLYPRPYAWVENGYYKKWKFVDEMSKKAAYPTFPSQLLKEWMGSYFKGYMEKGIVIPHQIDDFREADKQKTPLDLEPEKFNLLHAGNLLHARNPEGLIKAFKLFIKKDKIRLKDARLYFIGSSQFFDNFLKDCAKETSEIRIYTSKMNYEAVRQIQNAVDVNIILEAKSEISPFLPGKFPHCIAANKPILLLGPYYSESRRLLGQGYPFWSEIDEVDKIVEILELLYAKWKKGNCSLDREDLKDYLSTQNLEKTIKMLLKPA